MVGEIWTATPAGGFTKLTYSPTGDGTYPVDQRVTLDMPEGYDPRSPQHDPFKAGFPAVTPLLQGFSIRFGTDSEPEDHHLRGLRVDVLTDGWNVVQGQNGIVSQGPDLRVVVGLRDDSAGSRPDDPFIAWIHYAALVVYP